MTRKAQDINGNSLRVVIPSRKRVKLLRAGALRLFPYATVTVAESEATAYAPLFRDGVGDLVLHPDDVTGIGPLRQWVLDNFDDEAILFVDDDVHKLVSLVGYCQMNITSPANALAIAENAATIAREMGAPAFGFSQSWDVRKFKPTNPFLLNSWAGGVIGVIGRELRYDTGLLLRADIDFCLQALQRKRITFIDDRFSFVHRRWGMTGGNALHRSAARNQEEIDYLQRKWGECLAVRQVKTTTRLMIQVRRRQGSIRLADDVTN